MKQIKIIDKIDILESKNDLSSFGLRNAKTRENVFLHQGDMDGACAVYSLMMDLVIIGAIKIKDTEIDGQDNKDKREAKQRMFKAFTSDLGLIRSGLFIKDDLKAILDRTYSKYVTSNYTDKDTAEFIKESIDEELPCVIGVDYKGKGGHAMCAIGYEYDEKKGVTKIFCLDPGSEKPFNSYWNAVVILNCNEKAVKYRDCYVSDETHCYDVKLSDALSIKRKSIKEDKEKKHI